MFVSVGFYLYLTSLGLVRSLFGGFAAVIVLMAYLYSSTTTFLVGAQLDSIIRAQPTGALSGVEVAPSQRS